jgi:hypothetical protein
MAILSFRTSTYARNIYIFGTTSFDSIPFEYHEPVKQHAAATYSEAEIQTAFENLWISQLEYEQTMTYRTAV